MPQVDVVTGVFFKAPDDNIFPFFGNNLGNRRSPGARPNNRCLCRHGIVIAHFGEFRNGEGGNQDYCKYFLVPTNNCIFCKYFLISANTCILGKYFPVSTNTCNFGKYLLSLTNGARLRSCLHGHNRASEEPKGIIPFIKAGVFL